MLGSALAGFSRSMEWLIAARAIQGMGGGGMMSMPRATVGDIFNPKERGNWIGLLNAVFGLSAIIGPYLGGWMTDKLGWRWIFYINLPVALACLRCGGLRAAQCPHRDEAPASTGSEAPH